MNSIEAQKHIAECRLMLEQADAPSGPPIKDKTAAYSISALITAVDQLALVVADLASREHGAVIM
jgi:hypothetical protein